MKNALGRTDCHAPAALAMTSKFDGHSEGTERSAVTVGIRNIQGEKGETDCHVVEAQDTTLHFMQA